MTPIDEDDFLMYKTYLRPYNRRSGQGSVALNMKYAGWRVSWRGAELEIYAANVSQPLPPALFDSPFLLDYPV